MPLFARRVTHRALGESDARAARDTSRRRCGRKTICVCTHYALGFPPALPNEFTGCSRGAIEISSDNTTSEFNSINPRFRVPVVDVRFRGAKLGDKSLVSARDIPLAELLRTWHKFVSTNKPSFHALHPSKTDLAFRRDTIRAIQVDSSRFVSFRAE